MIVGILTIAAIYLVVVLVTLGLGISVGYLVNWVLPSIGLGSAVIVGMIANVIALIGVVRFLAFKMSVDATFDDDDDDDDDDEPPPPRPIVYVMDPSTSSSPRRRRRKG